jgi:hypothetical protein
LTVAATGRARGQSVVVINENSSVSTNAVTGAAKWISPSAFVASSLETGRIGYIVAWGGNEYGYAYTYALSGAPAGVTRQKFPDVPRRQMPRRVAAALDKLAPDVIAINGWSEGGAIAALRWSLRHSVPVVLCSDSSAHDEPRVWWKEWIKSRIVRLCGAYLVGGAVHADYIRLLLSSPDEAETA